MHIAAFLVALTTVLGACTPVSSLTPELPPVKKEVLIEDDAPAGLRTYRSETLGFELYYPDTTDWSPQDPEMIDDTTSITLREYPRVTATYSPNGTIDDEIAYWKKMSVVQARTYESATLGSQRIVIMPDDTQISVLFMFPHPTAGFYTLGVYNVDPIAAELLDPIAETFRLSPQVLY